MTMLSDQEVRKDDRSRASTMQWQANKSHYLHKFLHGNMLLHMSNVDNSHLDRLYKYYRWVGT